MNESISSQRVWLTGASYGLGRALALEYARRGAFVGLTARSEDLLEELLRDITDTGGRGMVLAGDVTDSAVMAGHAEAMCKQVGGIDLLVANAGSHVPTDIDSFDVDEYMDLMNLNYAGVLNCVEAVLPGMIEAGSGHVAGVASLAGYRGVPSAAAYGASKAALIHFLESMRFHAVEKGIKVTIVNPGFVRTPLTDKNDFHMPFLVEPGRAARIICDGIQRGRREITFPFLFALYIRLLRILPMWLYTPIMRKTWKRMNRG